MPLQSSPSSEHKASPVEMLRLREQPPPGSSPTHDDQESELRRLLQEAASLESRGHVMQSLHVRERALLVQYTQTLTEIEGVAHGSVVDPQVRPYVDATIKRARTLVLQLNGAAVRLFKADDFDSAGQLLATAIKICDSSDNYSYFFDNWEMRLELKSTTYNNLGCMERRRGRLAVALQYLRQALELPATPSAALHLNVSGVLAQLGRLSEAMYAAQKAITVADESHGTETIAFPGLRAVARHNLSTILEKNGELKEAVTVAAEAVQLAEAELGASSPTTVPIRQTFNRLQAISLREEQEELIKQETEREAAERQKEIQLADEQRRASQRNKKRGGVRNQYGSSTSTTPQKSVNSSNNNQSMLSSTGTKENMTAGHKGHQDLVYGTGGQQQLQNNITNQQNNQNQSVLDHQSNQQQHPNEFAQTNDEASAIGRKGGSIGFIGSVRKVADTRPGYNASGQPITPSASEHAPSTRSPSQQGTNNNNINDPQSSRPPSSASYFNNSSASPSSPSSPTGPHPPGGEPREKKSLTDRLMKQANNAGLGISMPKPNVVRTIASEEAALGDVVNFLSHRLGALLKNEETDTRKFAAARCIQCAMRVALAKNELSRRKVRRYQIIQIDLDDETEAAHLIISFFLRLRERRRRHKEDRRIEAEKDQHQHRCAIQIQTLVRLWRAKRVLGRMRAERHKQTGASIVIQRQMRRVLALAKVSKLRGAQAQARYNRVGLERLEYAAQVIQRSFRMHFARNQKLIRQGDFKQALARDWRALRNHSALLIQKIARGFLTRKNSSPILRERNKLRRNREVTRKRLGSSKLLQSVGRAYKERRFLLGEAYPVFVRCRKAEREAKKAESSCTIQRAVRCMIAKNVLKHLRQERYQHNTSDMQGVLMLSQRQLDKFGTDSLSNTLTGE